MLRLERLRNGYVSPAPAGIGEADMDMFGFSIADRESPVIETTFAIWQDNVAALEVFLACHSQWRILAGFDHAVYLGLDYPALKVVLEYAAIPDGELKAMFNDIQQMEWAALEVFNAPALQMPKI